MGVLGAAGAVLAVCAISLGPVAFGGTGPPATVKHARHLHGDYKTGNQSGISNAQVGAGESADFYFKVKNKTSHRLHLASDTAAGESGPGFRIHWYRGQTDVSDDFQNDVYEYHLQAGQHTVFRAHVHLDSAQSECVDLHLYNENPSISQIGFSAFALNNPIACA
jgi:hypothetical protein